MNDDLLLTKVRTIVAETLNLPMAEIGLKTAQGKPAQWDSMGHLNIVLSLEQEFDVSITPELVESMVSVEDIVRQLRARV
jgi:acyl carrier protein